MKSVFKEIKKYKGYIFNLLLAFISYLSILIHL